MLIVVLLLILFIMWWLVVGEFHYIRNVTVQYSAEILNCVGRNRFVSLEPRYLRRADIVFVDKCILTDAPRFHGNPQSVKFDHCHHPLLE